MEFVPGACDSSMEAELRDMQPIVHNLIAPLLHQGPVNYDFHDLHSLLGTSGYFRLWTAEGYGEAPLESALGKINAEVSSYFKMESERLTILLSCNSSSIYNLEVSDMECLTDFISCFSDGIDARWGIYFDSAVKPGNIHITVIITGQNIQYDD